MNYYISILISLVSLVTLLRFYFNKRKSDSTQVYLKSQPLTSDLSLFDPVYLSSVEAMPAGVSPQGPKIEPKQFVPPETEDGFRRLLFYVVPYPEGRFPAETVLSCCRSLGFNLDKTGNWLNTGPNLKCIIQIAHLLQPGHFLEFLPPNSNQNIVAGLVLYSDYLLVSGGEAALQKLLSTAHLLAKSLDGLILDEQHRVVTAEVLQEHYELLNAATSLKNLTEEAKPLEAPRNSTVGENALPSDKTEILREHDALPNAAHNPKKMTEGAKPLEAPRDSTLDENALPSDKTAALRAHYESLNAAQNPKNLTTEAKPLEVPRDSTVGENAPSPDTAKADLAKQPDQER